MSLDDDRIEEALARILAKRGAGNSVSVEAVVAENPDLEEPLRARLRVYRMLDILRDPPNGASPASSVLQSMSRAGTDIRPVSLPDPADDDPAPVVIPQTPSGRWGRYSVQGEIARGGVGVVLKARDPDLGRDVALKILREEYASSPDVLQRFVEEAQVGGQLQHPGIVPVYELGLGSDGQPYFVMKLVKGKTLASLLAKTDTPAMDRPRLLSVFHAVCQTVAYAHERRIVHRDLKPSNVMVGAFGEVQVLDWGMAKVLSRGGAADDALAASEDPRSAVTTVRSASGSTPSIAGSVLGTPQYMAPEQARGEVDRLDERADVFSLGAILCEILTGKPPHTGTDREILSAAAEGRLEPAHERLRSCGADPDLVTLATRCLSAEKSDRPRDAGVLARDVTVYLASLEERARKAEVAAGESRVLAVQERRARRLTLSLSAAVVAFVLLGGGGWYWVDHQRRMRADAADRRVAEVLEDATRLRARAEAAGTDAPPSLWHEALMTARSAQGIAETSGADEATKGRVASFVSEIAGAERRAQAAAEQRGRDDTLAGQLDEIRLLAIDRWNKWDWKATSAAYASAFRGYLGVDAQTLGIEETARRIDASTTRERLVLAIRSWMSGARQWGAEDQTFLGDLLARVDTDPWRANVRRATGNLEALRAIAAGARLDALDVQDILWLAGALARAGDLERAVALALEGWRRHPGDVWACSECASWLQQSSPPRSQEAIRFITAVLAIRPRSAAAHCTLATALAREGDSDGGILEFREAIRLDPMSVIAHHDLGAWLGRKGDIEGGIAECREAVRLDPKSASAHSNLAVVLKDKGDLDDALVECREAIRLDPEFPEAHSNLSVVLTQRGDLEGGIAEGREAVRFDPKHAAAHSNLGLALHDKGDPDGAIAECREAIRLNPRLAEPHNTLGISLFDKGDLDGAITEYREAIRLDPQSAMPHSNLGNGLFEKGDVDGAITEHREAIRLDPKYAKAHGNLGIALNEKGDVAGAIAECREAVRLDPRNAISRDNLGRLLRDRGDRDGAFTEIREALRLAPTYAKAHSNLGGALLDRGDVDAATAECREAIRLDPRIGEPYFFLGFILRQRGQWSESLESFRKARERAPPSRADSLSGAVKDAERLVAAAERFPAFTRGEESPASAEAALGLAKMGYSLAYYVASSTAWARAFAMEPSLAEDRTAFHRYNAACAAALAASGKGTDASTLDDAGRARWRKQALEWLRADLDAGRKEADAKPLRSNLEHWKQDPDLAGLRDEAALAKMSAEDGELCRALWRDVDHILSESARPK